VGVKLQGHLTLKSIIQYGVPVISPVISPNMVALARQGVKQVPISSTCTVFAESEVISYLASGRAKDEIIRGLFEAVVDRLESMALCG